GLVETAGQRVDVGDQRRQLAHVAARTYDSGLSVKARRQPVPQNQNVVPSWTRCSDDGTVATVMPQTGSVAVPGAAPTASSSVGVDGASCPGYRARLATNSARIERATSSGVRPPRSSPAGVRTRAR